MKPMLILFLVITLSACSSTMIRNASMIEAHNALNKGKYEKAIEQTVLFEAMGDMTPDNRAKLHYLRAMAQEGLGRQSEAMDNYHYVVNRHSSSAYAISSKRRLEALVAASEVQ